jgi:hypothetical protein
MDTQQFSTVVDPFYTDIMLGIVVVVIVVALTVFVCWARKHG